MYFTIDEWKALPWWQQELYMEELEYDAPWEREDSGMVKRPPKPPRPGDNDSLDDISTLGIKTERTEFAKKEE